MNEELKSQRDYFKARYQTLTKALMNAPAMPEPKALKLLGSICWGHATIAREIQMERDAPNIPFVSECESGAGFWDSLTRGQWRDGKFSDAKSKIKMTKELPTDGGWYYHSDSADQSPSMVFIGEVTEPYISWKRDIKHMTIGLHCDGVNIESMGGYWAKVEKDQFEFEG